MRESIFNIYYNTDDKKKLAFNSVSCGLALVDNSYEALIKNINHINDENVPEELKEVYALAKEGNFIVEDNKDELAEIEFRRNIQKHYLNTLAFTIAPTLACNFKCIYCYESSKSGLMSDDVQKKLVEFVRERAKNLNELQINWYGGEPLLAENVIYNLSDNLIKVCEDNDIKYEAFMISNGSLLSDKIIENLMKYRIHGVQITVDGPPEIHDKRRISKNGVCQFDNILNNINKLLSTEKIEVVVRINVDKTNTSDIEKLISIFDKKLISKKIRITFGQVTAYTEVCKSIESSCYSNIEFATKLLSYYEILSKYGFNIYNEFPYPEQKFIYCCAESANSFVVDFEGYFYKCWNEVGNISRAIGNVMNKDLNLFNYKHALWLTRNPVRDANCSKCNILPICMGGCPYNSCVKKQANTCDIFKYNLRDIMLKYYQEYIEQ